MTIFKANDIRGIYGKELFDTDAYTLGNAFVPFIKEKTIIVGRDNRLSSPALHRALLNGITDAGANVIDIGIIDSPGAYFASHTLQKPLIMITASHNPPSHNGFYICGKDAVSIYRDNGLPLLAKKMQTHTPIAYARRGNVTKTDIRPAYLSHILSFAKISKIKKMKIVIDAGNGVGALTATEFLKKIPQIGSIKLFFDSDGSFPNRAPDTSIEENLVKLGKKVVQEKADWGIAFDGDADRVAFVDEKGNPIDGSLMGAWIARHLLVRERTPQKVVYTIGCSRIVPEIIHAYHGMALREKVGHSFVNHHMRKEKALFGIEHTGHYFYKDNFYTESPFITFLLACEFFSKHTQPFSQLIAPLKRYYRSREISFPASNQMSVLERLKKTLKGPMDLFDGIYCDRGAYWFRVRASQTEPLIRFQVEAKTQKDLERAKIDITKEIKRAITSSRS